MFNEAMDNIWYIHRIKFGRINNNKSFNDINKFLNIYERDHYGNQKEVMTNMLTSYGFKHFAQYIY